jgi:hypothetical protein
MSIRVRALILAAMVVAMNLAAMTGVAQAQPPDGAAQFRLRQQAVQEQPTAADATQRQLAERWNTDYYQATHMSPAQHRAWLQAHKRFRSTTRTPTQASAQVPPAQASGHPGRPVAALTLLVTLVAGLAMLAARRATRRSRASQAS